MEPEIDNSPTMRIESLQNNEQIDEMTQVIQIILSLFQIYVFLNT